MRMRIDYGCVSLKQECVCKNSLLHPVASCTLGTAILAVNHLHEWKFLALSVPDKCRQLSTVLRDFIPHECRSSLITTNPGKEGCAGTTGFIHYLLREVNSLKIHNSQNV